MDIHLPDCSHYQGAVNWRAVVNSGCHGGIVKATEGLGYTDPFFARHWTQLGQMGAVRGAYHFAKPQQGQPENQADRFLQVVGQWRDDDLLILDLEVGDGDLSGFALAWLNRVEARTGILPWFYSYAPFIRAHIRDKRLARFPLWLAAYTSKPPVAPPPWADWKLWQHTNKANVPGISTPADHSRGRLETVTFSQAPQEPAPPPQEEEPMPADGLAAPGGGVWVLTKDGGIFAYKGAPFYGSIPALKPENRPAGPFTELRAWDDGYAIIGPASRNEFNAEVMGLINQGTI